MTRRRIAPAVVIAAIGLFAIVSAPRLQLDYAPTPALPQLQVNLGVAGGASDPEEISTRWVIPIESAIRSLGGVTGTRAEVTNRSASITVRFHRGTDVEVKAARLSAELASVRAKLPARSRINVWPASQGSDRPSAQIALTGTGIDARRIADQLRAARGVRDVETFGLIEREVEIAMNVDSVSTGAALDATRSLAPRPLGTMHVGAREIPVVAAPRTRDLRDAPLRAGDAVIRLGAVADVRSKTAAPMMLARVNGKPAVVLAVYRDADVSLFAFDASVRERLRGVAHEVVESDASELRRMLGRVAIGAAIASLLLATAGFVFTGPRGLTLGLYVPIAAAVAMNVFRLAGMTIDAHTIIVACIAVAGIAPFAIARLVSDRNELWPLAIAAVFALLLPLASTYAGGTLAPVLAPASRAFVAMALSALLACLVIRAGDRRRDRGRHGGMRNLLRESASVVLAAAAISCVLLTYFGGRLDPRTVGENEASTLNIEVTLPAGATLAQTSAVVANIERRVLRLGKRIESVRSRVSDGSAEIALDLAPQLISPGPRWIFLSDLHAAVGFVPGMISLDERNRGHAVRFTDDFEAEPFTDDMARVYRVLLKGTDADVLRRTADLIPSRLARLNITRTAINAEWPRPALRAELVPRPATPAAESQRVASRLAELTQPAPSFRLHDGRVARVIARGAPRSFDVVPQRADLLAREPSLPAHFEMRDAFVPGGVQRELGRFVLPVRIRINLFGDDERVAKRLDIDRTLSTMPLPAGITIERPSLSEWTFSVQKLRLFALAAFLPVLLFAAAAIALGSLRGATAAVVTPVAGIAAAAPALQLASANVDELTLLAMGASVCCTTALAVVALLRARELTSGAYRAQRRFTVPALAALVAVIALLAVPASAVAAGTDGWRAPMLAALAVLAAGVPCALLVAPAIGFVTRDLRRQRTPVARAASHPVEWGIGSTPHLTIRNLTKRYGDGFRALHRVSFELSPGIIGLLGPNGAGKTTLLRVMTGLLLPTRGQLQYRGVPVGPHNLAEYRRLIGFLPQEFNAYAGLTATGFLDFWALERGITAPRERRELVERLLETVGLAQDANRRVRDFSGGMRQRIGIARALLGDPPLLIVDEPTTGLDLESRNRFRDLLGTLAGERIIILSTHIAGDVEATASRILLLAKGTLRWDGSPEEMIARARGRVFDAIVSESEARSMTTHFRVTTRQRVAGGVHVRGVVPAEVKLPGDAAEPTLEEAYLAEVAGDRALRSSGFAFLFDKGQ